MVSDTQPIFTREMLERARAPVPEGHTLVMSHGVQIVVPVRTEDDEKRDEATRFWRECNDYAFSAWQGHVTHTYEREDGGPRRGGGATGFQFKAENHHPTIMEENQAVTVEELFGPVEGPYDADDRQRYMA